MRFHERVAVATATNAAGTTTLGTVLDTNCYTFSEQGP